MNYFELSDDMMIPGRWHLGEVTLEDGARPTFTTATRLEQHTKLSSPITEPGLALDFTLDCFRTPLVAHRLAVAVASVAGPDVQVLPVLIEGRIERRVLNCTRNVACLDEQRSEFLKWTERDHRADLAGQYRQVTKLAVNLSRIPDDADFFRIDGWRVALVVSDRMRNVMERAGCFGAMFENVGPFA